MKIRTLCWALCLFIIIGNSSVAQQSIKGTIQDDQANTPIAFASIGIKNKSVGVVQLHFI